MSKENTLPPLQQPDEYTQPAEIPVVVPVTVKPSFKNYIYRFGIFRIVILLLVLGFAVLRFGVGGGFLVFAIALAIALFVLWRLFERTITVTDTEIIYRNGLGMKRSQAIAETGTIKFVMYADPSFGPAPRVLIGDKNGDHFLSVSGLYWSYEDEQKVLGALQSKGVKIERYKEVFNSAAISRYFGKLLPVADRHPVALAFGIITVFVVGLIVWFIATEGID